MLLHSAEKEIDENGVTAVLTAAGVDVDGARVKALVASLGSVDIGEAMATAVAAPVAASAAPAALAQKEIPKAEGHDQCPLGYLNTFGTTCVSPIYYEVAPTNGKACKEGWMNISAGYCKKKKGPLGILCSTRSLP